MTKDEFRKVLDEVRECAARAFIKKVNKEIMGDNNDTFELIEKNGILYYKEISKK